MSEKKTVHKDEGIRILSVSLDKGEKFYKNLYTTLGEGTIEVFSKIKDDKVKCVMLVGSSGGMVRVYDTDWVSKQEFDKFVSEFRFVNPLAGPWIEIDITKGGKP